MCQYRYHYYTLCRHQTFTVFSLCGNATIFTSPVQHPHEDIGETAIRNQGDRLRSPLERTSSDVSQSRREPPIQNQALDLNKCQHSGDLQRGIDAVSRGKEIHALEADVAVEPLRLTNQRQNVTPSTPNADTCADADVDRGISAGISEYDHSWVEHYPLPPRIRTRTQSQEDLFTKGRYAKCKGYLSPGTEMPRVSSLPSLLDPDDVRDECGCALHSERAMATDVGAASTSGTCELKATAREWSDQSSSTSSLATFITAPESPVRSWSPSQKRWSNQSPTASQLTSPDILGDKFPSASTPSNTTDHIVSPSEADDTIGTATLADSPACILTEKVGSEFPTAKARVGNTELSAGFLLRLVSDLPSESYKDICQKYPMELESLLQLRQAPQSSQVATGLSSRALTPHAPPPADASPIATVGVVSKGYLADDSGHEVALAEARRGKRRAANQHQKQEDASQEQVQLRENWLEPLGQKQDRYFSQSRQAGVLEPSTFDQNFLINGPGRGQDQGPGDSANITTNDLAIIAQGQIMSSSGGRGKPTRRAKRKKYSRFLAADKPSGHTPAPSPRGSNSEPNIFTEFPQLVSDTGHAELAAKMCYTAQVSPVLSALALHRHSASGTSHHQPRPEVSTAEPNIGGSAGLQGNLAHYHAAHLPPVSAPAYFPPLAIQNNTVANPSIQPAWPNHVLPTIWMDYYGKIHSRKATYPKCKWVGNETTSLPKPEGVLLPGWTNQVASASARHKRAQHSFPQFPAYRVSMNYLRSPECSPSGNDHVPGRGLATPPKMVLGLAGRASGRYERARRSLPTLWVGQHSTPEELLEPRNRMAEGVEPLRTGGNPYVGRLGARSQEEDLLANERGARSSGEGVKSNLLEGSLYRWNAQLEKHEATRSIPHTPVEIITGFLPCRKCEVTSAIEDFVVKCPKCDPDYQHESDPCS
jgi:hypothetical protein